MKEGREFELRRENGSQFHSLGAEIWNAREPTLVLYLGSANRNVYLTKSRVLEEPAGKCRFASVEGFVSQKGQFKSYSEFNRKTDVVGLMSMFIVGHTTLCELRSFGYVAAF